MCIALKNLDRKEEAVLMASKGLALFPSYYDLLVYRAKLYQADGIYDLAEKDYDSALVVR
jgi:tetratricopeptide (TPR) repeat protein